MVNQRKFSTKSLKEKIFAPIYSVVQKKRAQILWICGKAVTLWIVKAEYHDR